ncbi:hypothetical protein V7O61_07375 [Methanolobus sp. WCC1]|uniref:hypothetical protein n=1 Tax=unclassified Methanolobus TaxID=2629569 RepID=UPI00258ADB26|nr:hypothetical protein [Methanolobus sp.]MDK2830339.1 hypothetical protein [Methanolobus sp.]
MTINISNARRFLKDIYLKIIKKDDHLIPASDNEDILPGITAMRDYIIEGYYNTDFIHSAVSRDIIIKLEHNLYTDEEIEFLYIAITERFDRFLGY